MGKTIVPSIISEYFGKFMIRDGFCANPSGAHIFEKRTQGEQHKFVVDLFGKLALSFVEGCINYLYTEYSFITVSVSTCTQNSR